MCNPHPHALVLYELLKNTNSSITNMVKAIYGSCSCLILFAYFLCLFELVSLLSKQFNAFQVYILLLHVFS